MDINNIEDVVQYLNLELQKDKTSSVNKLAGKIGLPQSTLKSRLRNHNYKFCFETREYIKQDDNRELNVSTLNPKECDIGHPKVRQEKVDRKTIQDGHSKNKARDKKEINVLRGEINSKCDNMDTIVTEVQKDKMFSELDKRQTDVTNTELKIKLIKLAENYERIIGLLEEKDIRETNVSISLPEEKNSSFRVTMRINDIVWEEFKVFAEKHKELTQKDLVSQAILNFIRK